MQPSEALIKALAATMRVMGSDPDIDAARMFASDLSAYPEDAVLDALTRCRREVRGRLTLADVIARIDDGRPGVEEAWAMLPRTERDSVVWCEEMARAYGACYQLLDEDMTSARMAFKETYAAEIAKSRADGVPVKWTPSYGFDPQGRVRALQDAAERGRIGRDAVAVLIGQIAPIEAPRLSGPQPLMLAVDKVLGNVADNIKAREALDELRRMMRK